MRRPGLILLIGIMCLLIVWLLQRRANTAEAFQGADDINWDQVCAVSTEVGGDRVFLSAYTGLADLGICSRPNTSQSTYDLNNCNMTRMFMSSVIGGIPYIEQARAYCGARIKKVQGQYLDYYTDIVNKFINLESANYAVYTRLNMEAPAAYSFIVPAPLQDEDYAPQAAKTWSTAATGASIRSYKCVPFTEDEKSVLTYFKTRPLGTAAVNAELYDQVVDGICRSKGYYSPKMGVLEGCGAACGGCCMPSSDALPGSVTASITGSLASTQCPPPKVREYQLRRSKTTLVKTAPTAPPDPLTECFVSGPVDIKGISQAMKSRKMLYLQTNVPL